MTKDGGTADTSMMRGEKNDSSTNDRQKKTKDAE